MTLTEEEDDGDDRDDDEVRYEDQLPVRELFGVESGKMTDRWIR